MVVVTSLRPPLASLLLATATRFDKRVSVVPSCNALLGSETYLLPPDDQWPRKLLPAWPPYNIAPEPGALVYVRKRGIGAARVANEAAAAEDTILVEPLNRPGAGTPLQVARRKAEAMRGRGERRAVLLCGETESFRMLSRSQILPTDTVLEIGCSYGEATALLAARAKSVIAVDVSSEALRRAASRCEELTNIRFEQIDVVKQSARLIDDAVASGVSIVFVDINGNRAGDIVARLLTDLHERLQPALTVVKNRELYHLAAAASDGDAAGATPDSALMNGAAEFWASVLPQGEASMGVREREWRTPTQWRSRAGSERRWRAEMTVATVTSSESTRAVAASDGARIDLLPGAPASPSEWRRFLFTFRGTHGPFRLAEIQAAALTLGVDAARLRLQPASALASAAAASTTSIDAHTPRQPSLHSYGGDVGPETFQWVSLPSAEVAAEVASRCSLVRGAFEVWATAAFDPSAAPLAPTAALELASERWRLLARHAASSDAATERAAMIAPIMGGSWRVDVLSTGVSRPRTLNGKISLIGILGDLLGQLDGGVDLDEPDHVLAMLEDCRSADGGKDAATAHAPSTLFLGRRLAEGAAAHLSRLALSERSYLGRTTLPPDVAYLMAVQARVTPGSVVCDPFCGTGSTLMSCAVLGATTAGIEADEQVLHGTVNGQPGIVLNFREAGLEPPARMVLGDMAEVGDQLCEELERVDAIVTDPPYGLMEGRGALYRPLSTRLTELLILSCRHLRIGGRLVFLLPIPASVDEASSGFATGGGRRLPTAAWLEVEAVARQRLAHTDRLMATLVKVKEPEQDELKRLEKRMAARGGDGFGEAANGESHDDDWSEWWAAVDAIERANAPEARRVW